jgi:branched-chain amino acid transport system ATP-binding protein
MLQCANLDVYYGAVHALKGISLQVQEGQIVTLIGANGAGKSTTLLAISGLLKASQGDIKFRDHQLRGLAPHQVVGLGLIHCPEGRRVFSRMTVELGAYLRRDSGKIPQDLEKIFHLFPRLKERLTQQAGTLSGGEQQMLAIGRALMGRPKLLMLDEPSLGIAPILVQEIFRTIKKINQEEKVTILLVEQNANIALKLADQAYVLETGKVVLSGKAQELAQDPRIKEAYLGHS